MRHGLLPLVLLLGCGGAQKTDSGPMPKPAGAAQSARAQAAGPMYVKDVGFQTPESVVHDVGADVYLVSNIEGSPLERDDRAFISRVRPDGSVENLRWIDGARPDVELHAPKGLALAGEVLYVADIDVLRKFERSTGKALGSISLAGASFAGDICSDESGTLYVSDSGIAGGFVPSGTDAIYRVDSSGNTSTVTKTNLLGRPSGLVRAGGALWVVTFGSGELYRIDASGARLDSQKLPKGSLDGVAVLGERLFVSSWEAAAVYERVDGAFVERISQLTAPSDIGVDERRRRLLVPLFYDNTLVIYPL